MGCRSSFRMVLVMLALAGSGLAQSSERCVLMVLKFAQETVEVASKQEIESVAPRQFGTPQLSPLFYEVVSEKGVVLYAAELIDPRLQACHPPAPEQGGTAPAPAESPPPDEGFAEIRFPALREARRLAVFRRVEGETEATRRTLLEVSL